MLRKFTSQDVSARGCHFYSDAKKDALCNEDGADVLTETSLIHPELSRCENLKDLVPEPDLKRC